MEDRPHGDGDLVPSEPQRRGSPVLLGDGIPFFVNLANAPILLDDPMPCPVLRSPTSGSWLASGGDRSAGGS